MKKGKKSQKNTTDPSDKSRVIFDISDDDEKLFLDYLTLDTIPAKKDSSETPQPKKNPKKPAAGPLPKATIDLHGLTISEAESRLDAEISALALHGCLVVTIITGKGKHSENHSRTLAKEIPGFLRRKFGKVIVFLTELPYDPSLSHLPLKGSFTIKVLRQNRR